MILVHMDPDEGPELFYNTDFRMVELEHNKPFDEMFTIGQYIGRVRLTAVDVVDDALILYEQCINDWHNKKCEWFHVDNVREMLAEAVVDRIIREAR